LATLPPGHAASDADHVLEVRVTRLATLMLLTATFAPAAVMGALPIVLPVVVVVVGLAVAVWVITETSGSRVNGGGAGPVSRPAESPVRLP
jgi:hypothetical protein